MGNSKYVKGRALEYKLRKELEGLGFTCVRAAGSHSPWDLVAVSKEMWEPVLLIQVKGVKTRTEARRLIKKFYTSTKDTEHYQQQLRVWVEREGWFFG